MEYSITIILLFVLILVYFRIADKFNIIDKPNHRSAHAQITLRGGGVIFPIAFVIFSLFHINAVAERYWSFGLGLLSICTISFLDDLKPLSNKVRLSVHFLSVALLLYFADTFSVVPFWAWPLFFIVIIGSLNAYNFMDGINGITGVYSLVTLGFLAYTNYSFFSFTENDFIFYPIIACLIFLFFNFRKKAKCFAGDVGSMGIGFWILALITLLIIKTGQYKFILLLSVYGVEVVLTIIERIMIKENIFEAHRRHLYQLFANERKISHLKISIVYGIVQLGINIYLINSHLPLYVDALVVLFPLGTIYLLLKLNIKKSHKS